jgi:hypothetical protein
MTRFILITLGLYFAVVCYPEVRVGFDLLRYDVGHAIVGKPNLARY